MEYIVYISISWFFMGFLSILRVVSAVKYCKITKRDYSKIDSALKNISIRDRIIMIIATILLGPIGFYKIEKMFSD